MGGERGWKERGIFLRSNMRIWSGMGQFWGMAKEWVIFYAHVDFHRHGDGCTVLHLLLAAFDKYQTAVCHATMIMSCEEIT